MLSIFARRRIDNFWQLARKWFAKQFADLTSEVHNISPTIDNIDTSVLALERTTAKEQTLTSGISAIRGDIGNIQIDTTELAKQGSNSAATNTAILAALGDIGGDYVMATNAEYAGFKSHMQTEIANILTPITEEEE